MAFVAWGVSGILHTRHVQIMTTIVSRNAFRDTVLLWQPDNVKFQRQCDTHYKYLNMHFLLIKSDKPCTSICMKMTCMLFYWSHLVWFLKLCIHCSCMHFENSNSSSLFCNYKKTISGVCSRYKIDFNWNPPQDPCPFCNHFQVIQWT